MAECAFHAIARKAAASKLTAALETGYCLLVAPLEHPTQTGLATLLVPVDSMRVILSRRTEALAALEAPLARGEVRLVSSCRCGRMSIEVIAACEWLN